MIKNNFIGKYDISLLNNRLSAIRKVVDAIQEERTFQPIEYEYYIKKPLENFKVLYKFKGVYYTTVSKLYETVELHFPHMPEKRTFTRNIQDLNNPAYMWKYETLRVYAVYKEKINLYITCEGKILTAKNFSYVACNPANSHADITKNGERLTFSRAITVFDSFVETLEGDDAPYHSDGDFGNCNISNLFRKLGAEQ